MLQQAAGEHTQANLKREWAHGGVQPLLLSVAVDKRRLLNYVGGARFFLAGLPERVLSEIDMPGSELPEPGEVDTTKTVTLTEKDVRDAARLFRLISEGTPWAVIALSERELPIRSSSEASDRDALVAKARAVLHVRRLRSRHFERIMFGEPSWDILLWLYLAESVEARQTIGQLAELVETPLTTVLRWAAYLEKERLVERRNHPTDRRTVFIELTEKGLNALNAFLREVPG